MSCRPLSDDEGAVLEALAVRPATVDHLAAQLGWDTTTVTAAVNRFRVDGLVFGLDHLELTGTGRHHLPSERNRRIDPS